MLVKVNGAKCIGIDAVKVSVEVDIVQGIGTFLVGLADTAVKESLLRTVTALQARGYHIPGRKIVISLAPADLRKNGSGYDLPIALGIIAASGQRCLRNLDDYVIMGELGLDGSVRPVQGALPVADYAREHGFRGCILPVESAMEAVECHDIEVYGVCNLEEAVCILEAETVQEHLLVLNREEYSVAECGKVRCNASDDIPDFADIVGQDGAKRAVEVACSGNHNLILVGSPGSGKSSLAKAISGILPPMTREESLVTSKIYSVSGLANQGGGLMRTRPFRMPHSSASSAAIIGGGGDNILPGEVTLAHNGVLFMDEFGQIGRSVIEAMRGPLEDRKVVISRLKSKVEYPASFMLVAASNPCPCGYYGEGERCTCSPMRRIAYLSRLSGPILDRIDIHVWMHMVPPSVMLSGVRGESSAEIAERIRRARMIQENRFRGDAILSNAEMSAKQVDKYCSLSRESGEALKQIIDNQHLSMRAYHRILKVARTIADMAGVDIIQPEHLYEAAGYRFLDRQDIGV